MFDENKTTNKMTTNNNVSEIQERKSLLERFSENFYEWDEDYDIKKQFFQQADLEEVREIINNCEKIREIAAQDWSDEDEWQQEELIQELFDSHEMMPGCLKPKYLTR